MGSRGGIFDSALVRGFDQYHNYGAWHVENLNELYIHFLARTSLQW